MATTETMDLTLRGIYEIAVGLRSGDQNAAIYAFEEMADVVAESLCNAITMIDGLIVIGGRISDAYSLIAPRIMEHMNGTIKNLDGKELPRLVSKVYYLDNEGLS